MTLPRRTSSYTSALLLTVSLMLASLAAQAGGRKVIAAQRDTLPRFRGVAVGADLVGMGQLLLSDYGQWEAAVRANLRGRYFPVVEIGLGRADASDVASRMTYKTSAPYARVGVDFNVIKNKNDVNRIYVGGRYAFTSFKYDVSGQDITDPVWGDAVDYAYEGCKASQHWLELVAGIDAKIWGRLRMGWMFRYRRKLAASFPDIGSPWYIPGYGREGGSRIGASFHVSFEL